MIRSHPCGIRTRSDQSVTSVVYPLFMPVRNPRRSFAPVAPSVAPSGTPRGHD